MIDANTRNIRLIEAECSLLERLQQARELIFEARCRMYLHELRAAVASAGSLDDWLEVLFWHQRLCDNLQPQLIALPRCKLLMEQVDLQLGCYLQQLYDADAAQA